MRNLVGLVVALLVALTSASAWAGVAQDLGFRVKGKVQGSAQPTLHFAPTKDARSILVTLWRKDGPKIQRKIGRLNKGQSKALPIKQPDGKHHYKAKIEVTWAKGGKDTLRIQFDMTRAAGLTIKIDPKDVDLDGRSLRFELTAPGKKAELRLVGPGGQFLGKHDLDLKGKAAGTAFTMQWKAPKKDVAQMVLKAWSTAGFWSETTLKPISLRIPHKDVVFASGRANVAKSEEPKLKDTLAKLKEAAKMNAGALGVRLYIAGYCDTMGPAAGNRVLSTQRARSIGAWFRRKGLELPIFYQGFGEDVLAVKTPDETPEPANRRALYLLSTHTPTDASDFPKASWKKL